MNAAALKAVFGVFLGRGFESLPLRHLLVDRSGASGALGSSAPGPVVNGSTTVELRRRDYALLLYLAREPTCVFPRASYCPECGATAEDALRPLDSHACRLCKALTRAGASVWVPSTATALRQKRDGSIPSTTC